MFNTNNNAPIHWCGIKNLVKYQKISNYFDHNCLLNKILLTTLNVKNSDIVDGRHFDYFSKKS